MLCNMNISHVQSVFHLLMANVIVILVFTGFMSWFWYLWRNRRFYRLFVLSISLIAFLWFGLR